MMMHHGKIIEQYRVQAGLTQEQLAQELGVHWRTVQRIESTQMIRSTTRRWFLVGLLGIPASMLALEGEPPWIRKDPLVLNDDQMSSLEDDIEIR